MLAFLGRNGRSGAPMGGLALMGAILASLVWTGTAGAQDAAAEEASEAEAPDTHPEDLASTQDARRHFMTGIRQFQEHRYREAIQSFRLAAQLVPSADLWYNIARAHEELSEYEPAIEHYQRYLRDRVDPPDREQVEQHIEALRERAAAGAVQTSQPTAGILRLRANREGSQVLLDGEPTGEVWAEPREVDAGRHQLALVQDGYVPFRSEVSVEAGMTTAAYADLVPETRYRSIQNDRIFTWIAWGLGVASLGVSIGLGVHAASIVGPDYYMDGGAQQWAGYSDGLLGASIGLGVLGAILYFVEGRSVGTEVITLEDTGPDQVRGPDSE